MAKSNKSYRIASKAEIERMFHENIDDSLTSQRMTEATKNGHRFVGFDPNSEMFHERLEREPQLDHERIVYPHGTVIKQGQRRWLYRGEKQVYPSSVPTLLRKLACHPDTHSKELYRLVADMRIAEFAMLINHFKAVREWDQCDILYELLAQHYGLETPWLDITNDFNTALFFSMCTFERGKWRPLSKRDIERCEETRYGVIFRASQMKSLIYLGASHLSAIRGEERPLFGDAYPHNVPLPIGYQPFLRCTSQMGYGIYMRTPRPLQTDSLFEELRFEHDPKLCEAVYEAMDGGRAIYPEEGIESVLWHIEQIAHATCFSEEAFEYALKRNHLYRVADREQCLENLRTFKVDGNAISIDGHPVHIGKSRILDVDMRYRQSGAEVPGRDYDIHYWQSMPTVPFYAPWMLAESESFKGVHDMPAVHPRFKRASAWWDEEHFAMMYTMMYAELPDFWEHHSEVAPQ